MRKTKWAVVLVILVFSLIAGGVVYGAGTWRVQQGGVGNINVAPATSSSTKLAEPTLVTLYTDPEFNTPFSDSNHLQFAGTLLDNGQSQRVSATLYAPWSNSRDMSPSKLSMDVTSDNCTLQNFGVDYIECDESTDPVTDINYATTWTIVVYVDLTPDPGISSVSLDITFTGAGESPA